MEELDFDFLYYMNDKQLKKLQQLRSNINLRTGRLDDTIIIVNHIPKELETILEQYDVLTLDEAVKLTTDTATLNQMDAICFTNSFSYHPISLSEEEPIYFLTENEIKNLDITVDNLIEMHRDAFIFNWSESEIDEAHYEYTSKINSILENKNNELTKDISKIYDLNTSENTVLNYNKNQKSNSNIDNIQINVQKITINILTILILTLILKNFQEL